MHVAEQALFIAVSRLLWGFDIQKKIGADGQPIIPDENSFHPGVMSDPNDFEVDIKVRSPAHERVFRREWELADKSARPVKTSLTKRMSKHNLGLLKSGNLGLLSTFKDFKDLKFPLLAF